MLLVFLVASRESFIRNFYQFLYQEETGPVTAEKPLVTPRRTVLQHKTRPRRQGMQKNADKGVKDSLLEAA